jgi:hypothetical protein
MVFSVVMVLSVGDADLVTGATCALALDVGPVSG